MTHYRLIGITLLLAAGSMLAKASSSGQAITAAQIAAAISGSGLTVSAEQVSLLSDVVAKTSAPVLRVESVGPWERNISRVRLDCAASDECLPFIVTVHRSQSNDNDGAYIPSYPQAPRRLPVDIPASKTVVRIGSSAVLLLDGGHVHIQLLVICLENGSVGQTIRVTGKGRERTYMAIVGSDGSLRGTL
jgi:hypothetical protein